MQRYIATRVYSNIFACLALIVYLSHLSDSSEEKKQKPSPACLLPVPGTNWLGENILAPIFKLFSWFFLFSQEGKMGLSPFLLLLPPPIFCEDSHRIMGETSGIIKQIGIANLSRNNVPFVKKLPPEMM